MKKILAAAAILAGTATAASAADLPRKAPVYKAPILKVYDWTGFYIGANAGGSIGRDRTTARAGAGTFNETTNLSPAGAIGGGQIGYNWQFRNFYNLVLGVEADIQGSGQKDNYACVLNCNVPNQFQTYNQKLDWFGTARARVGLATGPVLSYVTGGYAYGRVVTSSTAAAGGLLLGQNISETRGGYVLGSGVEAQLGGNWTGKIEYLYVNLGTQRTAGVLGGAPFIGSSKIQDNIFRAGVNYNFGGNAAFVEPLRNWAGFYIGGNAGSIDGRDRSRLTFLPLGNTDRFTLTPDGYTGGGQIGYNWQTAAWVFGVEGDFQGSTAKDNKTCLALCNIATSASFRQTLPWLATGRARVGYSVGATLFYVTGGYAYGETRTRIAGVNGAAAAVGTFKTEKGGYTIGGGIESPLVFLSFFGPQWTAKTEYLYVDLGRANFTFPGALGAQGFGTTTREHIFRTGINYNFNAPVVAKY